MKFSVLQSVYKNDIPDFLSQSFQSIANNTVQPSQFVLVKDGEITQELEAVIDEWKQKLPLKVVGYEHNQGLAFALNYGLQFCETELVARMDSDDICVQNRFEIQQKYFEDNPDVVLLSGNIEEFYEDPNIVASKRIVPTDYNEITKYLKKRNAFNHMAVMFKKSVVIEAGNYQKVPYFEDYDLWIRIVQKGFKVANIPETLVKARIGNDMIGRRQGFAYAKHELFFLHRQLENKFISRIEYLKLLILRVPVRLLPKTVLKLVYKILR